MGARFPAVPVWAFFPLSELLPPVNLRGFATQRGAQVKIIVLNQKGGVGKSSITVNLAYGLALAGHRTLLIDLDPQAHGTVIYCPEIPKENTVRDVFLDRRYPIKKVIRPALVHGQVVDNLFIIPSNIHLATAAEQITARAHREKLLHNHLSTITDDFDFILVDCPPALGVLTVNAIFTSDLILIPTTYGRYSLDGIADLFASISEVKETDDYAYRVVRNCYDARNRLSNAFIEEQLEGLGEHLMRTVVRRTEAINQAQMNSEPVWTFDPRSNSVEDFQSLIDEMLSPLNTDTKEQWHEKRSSDKANYPYQMPLPTQQKI